MLLLAYDLLVLELQQLLLLLEVVNDLLERLFQNQYFFLQQLDFFLLLHASLLVLLSSLSLDLEISLLVLVKEVELSFLSLVKFQGEALTVGLVSQALVLEMDVALNLLNVSLSVVLGL